MANVKHGRSEKFEDGTKLKMQTEIIPPFLQGQFFGTNLKLIFRRGKIFSCRRNDIFGRYFGMILLYFGTNNTENEFQSMTASQGNQSFHF